MRFSLGATKSRRSSGRRVLAGFIAATAAFAVATPAAAGATGTTGAPTGNTPSGAAPTGSTPSASTPSGNTPNKASAAAAPSSSAPPAAATASTTAIQTGKQVEVPALTTETLQVMANPNGTFTATSSSRPVRVKKSGAWTPIDTTLVKNADGSLSPRASLAQVTFSPGGSGPAVAVTSPNGTSTVSLTWPGPLPAPRVSGNAAVYPDVLPGVDLRLAASGDSYTEVLVVHDAAAAADPALASLKLHLHATGVTLKQGPKNTLSGTDANGTEVVHAPQPIMWDSHPDPHAGPAPTPDDPGSGIVTPLPTTVTATTPPARSAVVAGAAPASDADLTLAPPTSALTGSGVTYPEYIDPGFDYYQQYWDEVDNQGEAWWNNSSMNAKVGLCDWSGCVSPWRTMRAYYQMNTAYLSMGAGTHATIYDAHFFITQVWNGANGCTAEPVDLFSAGPISSSTAWPGPAGSMLDRQYSGAGNGCASASLSFNAQSFVQSAANGWWPNTTFGLIADTESNDLQWKQFDNQAQLSVTYNYPPNGPTSLQLTNQVVCNGTVYTSDASPTFKATATDNNPSPLNIDLWYEMYHGGDDSATNRLSANSPSQGSANGVASGTPFTWQETYGGLGVANWQYRVRSENLPGSGVPGAYSGWSGWYRFTSMNENLSQDHPTISSLDFPQDAYGNAQWGAPQGFGQFTIGNGGGTGSGNVVGYQYLYDSNSFGAPPTCGSAPEGSAVAATGGGGAVIPAPSGTKLTFGHHTLYVRGYDMVGNPTGVMPYQFMVSPTENASATAHLPISGAISNAFLGKCLDDPNNSGTSGDIAQVWDCNSGLAQIWTMNANGTVTHDGLCLDVIGGPSATAAGTKVQQYTCNGWANQQWQIQPDANGYWRLFYNNPNVSSSTPMCLDDTNYSQTNGTQLQIWNCNNVTAQTWSFDLNPYRFEGQDALASAVAVGSVPASTLGRPNPTVQGNVGGVGYVGGKQLWWYGTGPDSAAQHVTLSIPFTTPVEADYALGVRLTSAGDYAQIKFSVDGNALTPASLNGSSGVFDAYNATCCGVTYLPLGGVHLTASKPGNPHTLTITVVGRNTGDTATYGYGVGLDFLQAAPINNVTAASFAAAMNNHGISDDGAPSAANLDLAYLPAQGDVGGNGTGRSLSKQALAGVGLTPGTFTMDGIDFTMPTANADGTDNVVAIGQTITLDPTQQIRANAVGLLVASTCGAIPASSATIAYSGGTASDKPITAPIESWTDGSHSTAAYLPAYYNTPSGRSGGPANVYLMVLPANPMAPLASVTLPYYGTGATPGSCPNALHVLAVGVRPQATTGGVSWIGSWAAAPDAGVVPPGGVNFANQTLREVVHPTFLGSGPGVQARIRFSNRFGTTPLIITAATAAAQTGAGGAATGTARALSFGGAPGITIAPGAEAYSDSLALPDTTNGSGNLAVSVYTAGAVASAPVHNGATTPVYLASGNQTADTAGAAATWPTTLNAWYFVSAVDVTSNASQATVAVLGDQYSAAGAPSTWVDDLPAAVANLGAGAQGFVNLSTTSPITVAGTANSLGQRLHNWWRLADGTGGTAADMLGNAPLAMSNTTWSTTDHPSTTTGSAVFNGTSSVGTTAATAIDTSAGFTASAWVKLAHTGTGNYEVVSQDSNTASSFMFGYAGGSNNTWWMYLPGGDQTNTGGPTIVANAGMATLNTWTHLTGVYDSTAGTMSLYVNGVLAATRSGVSAFKANGPLVVGRAKYNGTATDFWPGSIADVQVFAQALTPAEVAVLANGGGADSQAGKTLNAGVLDEPNLETVVIALGANDISHGDTPAAIEANLKSLVLDVKNGYGIAQNKAPDGIAPVNVVIATVPPMGLSANDPKEAARIQLNNDIVANSTNWNAIGYTDPAGATADTASPNTIKAADLNPATGSPNAGYYSDVAGDAASREAFVWGANGVNPAGLVAGLAVTPVSGTAPLTVTADASSTAAGAYPITSYTFDFGDGTPQVTQTTTKTSHTYTGPGTYALTLTVEDGSGALATAVKQVVVSGAGQTAITYAGRVGSNVGTTATTSATIPVGTPVSAGNAVVVSAMLTNQGAGTPGVTDTQGNTYTPVENKADSANDHTLIFVATNAKALTTADSITVAYPSAAEHHIAVDTFAGVSAIDQHTSATGTTTAVNSGSTAATTAADELVFGVTGVQGGPAATWTSPDDPLPGLFISGTSGDQLATAYQVVSATGSFAATGTARATWMSAVVTLK